MHAFDRQTDRRTDRIPIAIPRLHSMQRGKNLRRHGKLFKTNQQEKYTTLVVVVFPAAAAAVTLSAVAMLMILPVLGY